MSRTSVWVMGACLLWGVAAHAETKVLPTQFHGESEPLRALVLKQRLVRPEDGPIFEKHVERLIEIDEPERVGRPGEPVPDAPKPPFVQTDAPVPLAIAAVSSFEGPGTGLAGFSLTGAPPDTTLAVGKNHVIGWVNSQYAVFSKTGTLLVGPINGNTLFTGIGGNCDTTNRGDPILQYDRLADRWFLSQFAFSAGTTAPYLQCIAVSTTSDPLGTYYRYTVAFGSTTPDGFNDYGKLGIWPDGYYTAYNVFGGSPAGANTGVALCVSDRVKMLAGDPSATTLCMPTALYAGGGSFLPADLDGTTLPSDVTQGGLFIRLRTGTPRALRYLKLKPNFSSGTVTLTDGFGGASGTFVNLPVTITLPCNDTGGTCVAQPGTANTLDTLGSRLMYRAAFRNRAGVESLIVTIGNDPDGAGARSSAVRWFEIRNPLGNPADVVPAARPFLNQDASYDPGASGDRWMSSMAMDKFGNMLVGYSLANVSTNLKPSIGIAGRKVSDALNTLSAETIAVTGTGSQTGTLTRWGDYTTMQIDPDDERTFWYICEYLSADGTFNWRTRIVSYKFQNPYAVTLPASSVTGTAATLNGSINASTLSSTVSFEYGPTTSYGSTISATPGTVTGSVDTNVSAALTGLTFGATYHYRVIATNSDGTDVGVDQVFTTGNFNFQVGSLTLPATNSVIGNRVTRVNFSQDFGATPVVIVQPGNEDADPAALRIRNITSSGFDLVDVENPGCVGCTGAAPSMTVHWLAARPGSFRLNTDTRSFDRFLGRNTGPSVVTQGARIKVGTASTSNVVRSTSAGGFAGWPAGSTFSGVVFPAGLNASYDFTAPPVVLSGVQSWNNEGSDLAVVGTPALTGVSEPWLSALVTSVTATGMNLGLEASEVDDDDTAPAGLSSAETVGYIAIESGVSQSLTQMGSPALVGLATGTSVVNDSCTNTDLSFPLTAPVVAANLRGFAGKQTRTEDDGGWTRRCNMTSPAASTVRMQARIEEDTDIDAERTHGNETIGAAIFGGDFITSPVTLARMEAARTANGINVRFSTASEVGHLGSRIWGRNDRNDEWRPLHDDLITGAASDQFAGHSYQRNVPAEEITQIRIEDIDLLGRSRFHEPADVGKAVGADAVPQPINWAAIARSNAQSAGQLGGQVAGRSVAPNEVLAEVSEAGIQRLSFTQLQAAGWTDATAPLAEIAVSDAGVAVPRSVFCSGANSDVFGAGCSVEWVGSTSKSLYGKSNVYMLSRNINLARSVGAGAIVDRPSSARVEMALLEQAPNRAYNFSAPGNDPWYDERLLANGAPVELSRSFSLPGRATSAGPNAGPNSDSVSLSVQLWGGLDFPGDAADHSVQILLNNQVLASRSFDGLRAETITVNVPENLLQASNSLRVRLPLDAGFGVDVVYLDGFSLRYPRSMSADPTAAEAFRFGQINASSGSDRLFAANFDTADGFAFNGAASGSTLWSQMGGFVYRDALAANGATLAINPDVSALIVASAAQIKTPHLRAAVTAAPANIGNADYLIITNPQFQADLAPLVNLQQSRGYSVKVLATDAIYARGSDYETSPQAIREAIAQINPRFVLLVGGDSYDYDNNLGLGSVSFVPTFYRVADPIVRFAISDALYTDANGDGIPERALGRIPARTNLEVRQAIAAIIARAAVPATRYFATAGASGPGESFGIHARTLLSYLRQGQATNFGLVDEIGLDQARSKTTSALAGGPLGGSDWVNYLGHSSPNRWALQNVLDTNQLSNISRIGAPAIVTQWGCWNSYFVLPDQDTMSHALMLRPNGLAAAVIGSTSLAEDASHMALGTRFFDLVEDGLIGDNSNTPINTLGEALMAAKADVARSAPEHVDSNYSISLFGDPAQPLR
jgi:hypothetical protein